MSSSEPRKTSSQWHSSLGFIAAAAGSAVGLGNIWKFPYITGENGGGTFVLFYLLCILLLGLPIMIAEVMIGRTAQSSPYRALQRLASPGSGWPIVGAVGVFAGVLILSYYSIVAGWGLHYLWLAVTGGFPADANPQGYSELFETLAADARLNIWWHSVFMGLTIVVVWRGIRQGIERFANWGMLALLMMLAGLGIYGATLPGFGPAVEFVLGFSQNFTGQSALEALGHAFFSLSLGIGVMLTYGSYLKSDDDVVATSLAIAIADTVVALGACFVLFPIAFSAGLEPAAGPGLIFINIPLALLQLPGGKIGLVVFLVLLLFAALTSAISLLEMAVSFAIDSLGWSRRQGTVVLGGLIYLLGFPAALSGGTGIFGAGLQSAIGMSWFDAADYLASNWLLPLGGIGMSLFLGWAWPMSSARSALALGSSLGSMTGIFMIWRFALRWLCPLVIVLIMLYNLKIL